ncbi:MAG: cytochrome C [candidate division Zixibacteria bacterium]|nr:cytochrome C [candidate division Zixibacteria bacterium]
MIHRFTLTAVLVLGTVILGGTLLIGCSNTAAERMPRPDVVTIDAMTVFGDLERPVVQFPHDLHTAAVKEDGKDCTVCHLRLEDGSLSQKYGRLVDDDVQTVTDVYHVGCINCHTEKASLDMKSGPVACGECHVREAKYTSSRVQIHFDRSLHYRHVDASQEKCERCHHDWDSTQTARTYIKGKEASCRDCHKDASIGKRPSIRTAVHHQCVGCHLETPNSGPTVCAGCHDSERQKAITVVEDAPRLFRNQPDFVLLAAGEAERANSKMKTVPFSHLAHEGAVASCRTCHHEMLHSCDDCHTLPGKEEGGGVRLERAMHDMTADHSCVGCHERAKDALDCAGCHNLMQRGKLSEHACTICHTGPEPDRLTSVAERYTSLDQFRKPANDTRLSINRRDIPDTVIISLLSDTYEAVRMPHGRHIDSLMKRIGASKMATYFHGHDDVVCQGCHHHSPIGERPPMCESCHREPFNESDLMKPGLYGAYHRQCLGCHQSMQIEKPSACVDCHANKESRAE